MFKKWLKRKLNKSGILLTRYHPNFSQDAMLEKFLQSNLIDLCLDIGANTGQFSLGLIELGFSGRIISYEPLSEAYRILCKNSQKYPSWKVEERIAIGDYSGFVDINISGNSVSSSILPMEDLHSKNAKTSAYIGQEKVKIERLDNLALSAVKKAKNTLIKIDSQGFEWEILDGASSCLALARAILIELSFKPLYIGARDWKDIIFRMESAGFSIFSLHPMFSSPETGELLQCDALFVRNDVAKASEKIGG